MATVLFFIESLYTVFLKIKHHLPLSMCFTFIGLLTLLLPNNLKLPGNEANYGQYHNGKQYFVWDIWAMCMNCYDPTTNPNQRQALTGISREAYSYSHELPCKAVTFPLYRAAWCVHSELDRLMIVIKPNYSSAVVNTAERWLRWNPDGLPPGATHFGTGLHGVSPTCNPHPPQLLFSGQNIPFPQVGLQD